MVDIRRVSRMREVLGSLASERELEDNMSLYSYKNLEVGDYYTENLLFGKVVTASDDEGYFEARTTGVVDVPNPSGVTSIGNDYYLFTSGDDIVYYGVSNPNITDFPSGTDTSSIYRRTIGITIGFDEDEPGKILVRLYPKMSQVEQVTYG